MPIHITTECWAKWRPVFAELYADYGFFADTERNFNSIIAWYRGEGSSFRTESTHWRFVIDTIRLGDEILDITAITIITKTENGSKRDGWVITRSCDIHGDLHAAKVVDGRKLAWYKVSSDGRVLGHCCQEECIGHNTKHIPTRSWDATRWTALRHSHTQEIISLRQEIQQQRAESSNKRKRSEVIVMEDDIEKSPVVKKLRKAKSELEDNVAGVETQVHKLQKEIEGMRANFEKQLKQKDKMVRDISAEKAKAKSDYEIAHEKFEREKQATQAHYAEETRKKDSVIAQKNKVIAMKQATIDSMKQQGDDPFQNLQRKEKVIEEKMALIKEQGATIAQQRTEINQKKHDINVEYERAIRKLKEKLSVQRNITAERLRDAAEASNLRLELERRTEDVQRLKEELNHQSNSVVPSLMSSIQIKTDRVNQLESQLDSIMSANLSRLHTGPPSHASNIRSGQNNNGQNAIHSHQTNSTVGNDSPQSNQHRKKRRHGQSEPEVKTE